MDFIKGSSKFDLMIGSDVIYNRSPDLSSSARPSKVMIDPGSA
jgi:hypothetical protein